VAPVCPPWDDGAVAPEASALSEALAAHLLDPRLAGNQVSVSVWVDGLGEVLAHQGDERLLIASNQKLLTAMGVLDAFALDATLRTEVVAAQGVDLAAGLVPGELVLVGGGDPTLTSTGPHSLAALARSVRAAGIREVRGGLVVDESRFDLARFAPGWQDWHIPTYAGPMSALIVDDNRGRVDPAFLADPALGHGEAFRDRLAAAGVTVAGPVTVGVAPVGAVTVTRLDSPAVGDLLSRMLSASDNEVAESLKPRGRRVAGRGGLDAGRHVGPGVPPARRVRPHRARGLGRRVGDEPGRPPLGQGAAASRPARSNQAVVAGAGRPAPGRGSVGDACPAVQRYRG